MGKQKQNGGNGETGQSINTNPKQGMRGELGFAGSSLPPLPEGEGVDRMAACRTSPPNRSAQESGIPRPHGGDLGPPVSGVAGANVEWPLGRDPSASCVTGASFVWPLGRGGPRAA